LKRCQEAKTKKRKESFKVRGRTKEMKNFIETLEKKKNWK